MLRSPAAIGVNVSAAILATVIGGGMLLVVIVPLIMIGESMAGG